MADTVRGLMEAMVPELEDYERRGYFSRTEIASIVQRRQHFEYQLRRRNAVLVDYLRCVALMSCQLCYCSSAHVALLRVHLNFFTCCGRCRLHSPCATYPSLQLQATLTIRFIRKRTCQHFQPPSYQGVSAR